MDETCSSETYVDFNGLHGVISEKLELCMEESSSLSVSVGLWQTLQADRSADCMYLAQSSDNLKVSTSCSLLQS